MKPNFLGIEIEDVASIGDLPVYRFLRKLINNKYTIGISPGERLCTCPAVGIDVFKEL